MSESSSTAPVLSTTQDSTTFNFDKSKTADGSRKHLSLRKDASEVEIFGQIEEYYSIPKIVKLLKETKLNEGNEELKYKRVTLQFPDDLVCDAAYIARTLQSRLNLNVKPRLCKGTGLCECKKSLSEGNNNDQSIWILADTSYSACCVDEVAAEHVNSDIVLHFGEACLNPVARLSIAYVLGKPSIDEQNVVECFEKIYGEDPSQKVMLMADAQNTRHISSLYAILKARFPRLAYADLLVELNSLTRIIDYTPSSEGLKLEDLNRIFVGVDIESGTLDDALKEYKLFHILVPELPRLLHLTTIFQETIFYDPNTNSTNTGPFPNLMRRYRFMYMAKAAQTIGILVNTLSLHNMNELIDKIKKLISTAGKKYYLFVVGKPNVAKLANFETIDVWCVLGCDHQGIILDENKDYFKPIVTPYELLLALSDEYQWTGDWITNFQSIMRVLGDDEKESLTETSFSRGETDYDDDAPEFDPVTGSYVSTSRPLYKLKSLSIEDSPSGMDGNKSLTLRPSGGVIVKNTVSTSAERLQNRHWTGLGSDFSKYSSTEGALVEEGRNGIARGYYHDEKLA